LVTITDSLAESELVKSKVSKPEAKVIFAGVVRSSRNSILGKEVEEEEALRGFLIALEFEVANHLDKKLNIVNPQSIAVIKKTKPFASLSKDAHQYLSAKNRFGLIKKAEDSL